MPFDSVLGGESKKYISSNVQGLNPKVITLKNILKALSIPIWNSECKKKKKKELNYCMKIFSLKRMEKQGVDLNNSVSE